MATSDTLQARVATNFELPHHADVPTLARRGLSWSFILLVGRYGLSMGSAAVLARLLAPSDYGLMGMVATITALAQATSDFGLSWATVQRVSLSRNQIDALFLVNGLFGLLLTVACCLSAPYVAAFYHRPELTNIIVAASGALFLSALSVQPSALMRRQMKLKELSLCSLWALLISAIVTIVLARLGFGCWALVVQLVLQQGINTALSFPLSGYYPRLPQNLLQTGSLLSFGGYSAAYGIVNYFARNLDNVLVGKYWGAVALGYYTRAYFLMTLPGMLVIGVFGGVLIPAMASLRKDPPRMELTYIRALRMITVLGCSFAVGLAAAAPEIVDFVYGPKWHAVVPILLWLAAASILQPIQNTVGWLYIIAERGRGMFIMGLVVAGSATLAFVLGIRSGPIGVACGYAISNTIIAYPVLVMGHRACGLSIRRSLAEFTPLLLCALLMGAVVWIVGIEAGAIGLGLRARLALKVVVGIVAYTIGLWQFSRPTYSEILSHFSRSPSIT
jgi:O-antigen/teichoic acid export membrane protein